MTFEPQSSENSSDANALVLYEKFLKGTLSSPEIDTLWNMISTDSQCSDDFVANIRTHFLFQEKFNLLAMKNDWNQNDQANTNIRINEDRQLQELLKWEKNAPRLSQTLVETDMTRKRSLFHYIALCAAGLIVGCISFYIVWLTITTMQQELFSIPSTATTDIPAIARFVETIDVVWEEDSPSYTRGQNVGPCRFALKSGLVQLQFVNGTELNLEGPAEFVIHDAMNTFCVRGEISAFVGKQATGFTITTPFGSIVDRGTEFYLQVDNKKIDVVTVKGLVDLKMGNEVTSVPVGSAVSCSCNGTKVQMAMESLIYRFMNRVKFQEKLSEYGQRQRDQREKRNALLHKDRSLLVHFDASHWDQAKLANLSPYGRDLCSHLSIISCKRDTGRISGNDSIRFSNHDDYSSFRLPGQYRNLTLLMSVRINRLQSQGSVLLANQNFLKEPGAVFWQISREGKCFFYITSTEKQNEYWDSGPMLPKEYSGGWYTLAITVDADRKTITHYLDGRPVTSLPWKKPIPLSLDHTFVGNILDNRFQDSDRLLDGSVDELLIFNRVLTLKEIQRISQ